jgi:hypothetical protein
MLISWSFSDQRPEIQMAARQGFGAFPGWRLDV